MTKERILITGAAGNIGSKLRKAFEKRYDLVLIDKRTDGDDAIVCADLSRYENLWASRFADVSTVIHLAGNPDEKAAWDELFSDNIDAVLNVCHSCVDNKVERLIFASSCHTMGGYFDSKVSRITGDMKPLPDCTYGVSKVIGERICKSFSEHYPLSVICLRLGWVPHGDEKPRVKPDTWLGSLWLSNRDLIQIFDKSISAKDIRFQIFYAMSDNEGMVWDLQTAIRTLDYKPLDNIRS